MTDTSAPIAIPIPHLVATIRAHLLKADHSAEKSVQHFTSAGLHLAELKARYKTEVKASKSHTWPEYVEERFGLRRSRADELIRIGDGRDSIDKSRADKAESVRVSRSKKSPLRSGDSSPPPDGEIKAACAVNGKNPAEQQSNSKAEQRRVSEGLMRTLDLFERANVDPADRAAEIVEQFNRAIAEASGSGKFSIARIHRVIDAMGLVFTAITAELAED